MDPVAASHSALDWTAEEDPWLMAVLIEAGDDGLATRIEQLLVEAPG